MEKEGDEYLGITIFIMYNLLLLRSSQNCKLK